MNSCCAETSRARPLLGTFVEIVVSGPARASLDRAVDRAFDAVETVHRLMSFQDPASELSRFNRTGAPPAHPWTEEVIAAAQDFRARSCGAFDASAGLAAGLDLSGIAKGFAVDRAIEVLRSNGASAGTVNAGGDLAVFGEDYVEVGVRDPADPSRLAAIVRLKNQALASSGRVRDPATGKANMAIAGASVRASSCLVADALTKVVGVLGEKAAPLLGHHGAAALLFRDGRMVPLEA
jgi:FAD:protein FMN transferase